MLINNATLPQKIKTFLKTAAVLSCAGFLFFGLAGMTSAATNLILQDEYGQNSEFTLTVGEWSGTRATVERIANCVAEGIGATGGMNNSCLKVTNTASEGAGYITNLPITTGNLYIITARVFVPSGGTALRAVLRIQNNSSGTAFTERNTIDGVWQTLVVSKVAIAGETSFWIQLMNTGGIGEIVYWDAVTMQDMGETSTAGGTYYFDPTATYQGDGTASSPASAIMGVGAFKNFQYTRGLKGNLGGMQLLLKKGETFSPDPNQANLTALGMIAASNFTITSYGSGAKPIIRGAIVVASGWVQENTYWYISSTAWRKIIWTPTSGVETALTTVDSKGAITAGTYWFDDPNDRIYFILPSSANPANGILEKGHINVMVDFSNSDTLSITNLDLKYANWHSLNGSGVGNNVTLSSNDVSYSGTTPYAETVGGNGMNVYGASAANTGLVISNNTSNYNAWHGVEINNWGGATITGNTLNYNRVRPFETWDNTSNANIVFSKNLCIDNTYGVQSYHGNTFSAFNNIVRSTGVDSFTIKGGTGHKVYNNTIISTATAGANGVSFETTGVNVDYSNNILVGIWSTAISSTALYKHAGTTITGNNNLWIWTDGAGTTGFPRMYTGGTNNDSLTAWKTTMSPQMSSDLNADPAFIGGLTGTNYSILSTSPTIDTGIDVSLTTDYLGNSIYGTPDIGGYEYQPPYTFSVNNIPTTGSIRMYSDGKYRILTATTTNATGTFSVTPASGSYLSTTTQYMDITIDSWLTSGTKNKQWTATSTEAAFNTLATSTVYTIGDLATNSYYQFEVNGTASTTAITGYGSTSCTDGLCLSDSVGEVQFTYSGGYSTRTFALIFTEILDDNIIRRARNERKRNITDYIITIPVEYPNQPFLKNFKLKQIGEDVLRLQTFLNQNSDTQVAKTGAGSPGNETNFFGPLTYVAVIKFQEKFASEILTPIGLKKGTGFFGNNTRAKINKLLGF